MKISASSITFIIGILLVSSNKLYAWENEFTHPAITERAVNSSTLIADDYFKTQLGISNGLPTQLYWNFPSDIKKRMGKTEPEKTTRSILAWLRAGSIIEDEDGRKIAPWRPRHHFHAPIANPGVTPPNPNSGLDNHFDDPNWKALDGWIPLGQSALNWTILGTASQEPFTNNEKWSNARSMFYESLKNHSKNVRDANLAEALLKFGCILHMLEDMGVPAHTRNDFLYGHFRSYLFDWGNDLENWAKRIVEQNGGQCPWSESEPVAFDKITKFFDADVYTGDYLGDGVLPPNTWGLSECSNYQFLSTSTMFGCTGEKYQFPHPSKEHLGMDLTVPVTEGKKLYFNGSNYGVPHIARESYTYFVATGWGYYGPLINNTNTTDDVQVFEDYANIAVPRTIDYATGLLNYFFRGKLEIEPNCLDCNTVTFFISNDSNNSGIAQTLKGGTFELYWDDRDGNRAKVSDFSISGWTSNSELDYDQQVTGTFSKPDSNGIETYTVVYKGAISENPDEPDNNDSNAIAVGTLIVGYPIIAWGRDNEGEVSNVPEGNDFVDVAAGKYHALAIRSDGALAAWGWNSYGQCNVPTGNDFIAIAGGSRHSIALKSDGTIVGWGDNSVGQIDVPTGNGFVAIASGDYHNLAIDADGLVVGWGGWNTYGECDAPEPDEGTVFVAVSAGKYHSLALQSDGNARAWGSNNNGQTRIYSLETGDHEQVAAADDYNFLLLTNDMLVTWGGGDWAEPGIPDYHYRQPDEHDFVAIAAGGYHILALTRDGQILSWGYNDYNPPPYPAPEGITFTKDVAAGWKFSVALRAR